MRNGKLFLLGLTSSSFVFGLIFPGLTPRGIAMASPLGSIFTSDFSAAFLPPKKGNDGRVGSSGSLSPRKFAIPPPAAACLASPSSVSWLSAASAARARCRALSRERTSSSAWSGCGVGSASGALLTFLPRGSIWKFLLFGPGRDGGGGGDWRLRGGPFCW